VEFLWFVLLTFLSVEAIIFGVKLLKRERAAFKALGKRIEGDVKTLADETEAWLAKEWERRFGGKG